MSGEGFALLAALAYGLAGVTIIRAKAAARGDNGVFLSVLVTAAVSGLLWLGWGRIGVVALTGPGVAGAVVAFVAAGLASMVLGRTTMYRATERIGPVAASLLRRLTPVFALPLAWLFLAQAPGAPTLVGAAMVIGAVLIYTGPPGRAAADPGGAGRLGWLLGIASAAFYAASYTLRSHGLDRLPDAALGTCIGALAGMVWMLGAAAMGPAPGRRLARLLLDRSPWHWVTALALSAGQILQFFALKSASVVVVATLGALEVFFAALLGRFLIAGAAGRTGGRVWLAAAVAAAGTAMLMQPG